MFVWFVFVHFTPDWSCDRDSTRTYSGYCMVWYITIPYIPFHTTVAPASLPKMTILKSTNATVESGVMLSHAVVTAG